MHLRVTTITTLHNEVQYVVFVVLMNLVLTKAETIFILSDILILIQYPDNSLKPGGYLAIF